MSAGAMTRVVGALRTLATPALPLWWATQRAHGRMSVDLQERWGWTVPPVVPGSVWVHGASVGEIAACEPLIRHLDGPVLLTADTDTGAQAARVMARRHPHLTAGVRPVDHPWMLSPLWAEARPRALIFVEGAWWPGLAAMACRYGVPVLRVNGKVGARTRRLGPLYARWMDGVQAVVARDARSAEWFERRGVHVVGVCDLKRCRAVPVDTVGFRKPYVVGASTRPGDERALLNALHALEPSMGLLIAPRHPERFDEVWRLLVDAVPDHAWRHSDGPAPPSTRVLLLDVMGQLPGAIGRAQAAFIGGTFDPRIGGHSPTEAQNAGVAVVAGPHGQSDPNAWAGAVRVKHADKLGQAIVGALNSPPISPESAPDASKVAVWLQPWLRGSPAPPCAPRPWLRPVAMAVGTAHRTRDLLYDRGIKHIYRLDVPVVSVGSANARGAGKTPAAAWVARQLAARGHTVGIVVRGYRRGRSDGAVVVGREPDAHGLGDEGAELAQQGFIVAAGSDRVQGALRLQEAGVTVVVLEDGLQYRRLHRDLDVVVVDADHPSARGPLPAGERRGRVVPDRADAVLIIGEGTVEDYGVPTVRLMREHGPWHRGRTLKPLPPGPVVAVCGIGRPGRFIAALKAECTVSAVHVVPDHGSLPSPPPDGPPWVCTAKDAARAHYPDNLWWRPLGLRVTAGQPQALWRRLEGS